MYLFVRENITLHVLSNKDVFFLHFSFFVDLHNQYFWSGLMTMFQPATIPCQLPLTALTAGIYFGRKAEKNNAPPFSSPPNQSAHTCNGEL